MKFGMYQSWMGDVARENDEARRFMESQQQEILRRFTDQQEELIDRRCSAYLEMDNRRLHAMATSILQRPEVEAGKSGRLKPNICYSYKAREHICSTGVIVGYGNSCKEAYAQWRRQFERAIGLRRD